MRLERLNWRWLLMLVVAISLSATVTACGDDDDDEPKQEQQDEENYDTVAQQQERLLIGVWCRTYQYGNYSYTEYQCFKADGSGWIEGKDRYGTDAEHFYAYRVRYDDHIDDYCLEKQYEKGGRWEDNVVIETDGNILYEDGVTWTRVE